MSLDVRRIGAGPDIVLLHPLLSDRVEREGMEAILATARSRMFPEDFLAAHPEIADPSVPLGLAGTALQSSAPASRCHA